RGRQSTERFETRVETAEFRAARRARRASTGGLLAVIRGAELRGRASQRGNLRFAPNFKPVGTLVVINSTFSREAQCPPRRTTKQSSTPQRTSSRYCTRNGAWS